MPVTDPDDYVEKDAFWFDSEWCRDHPDYPLSTTYVEQPIPTLCEEQS